MDNEQNNNQYYGSYTGEQIDQAIEKALSPHVDKFNGRTGEVTPKKNDYTAEQISLSPPAGMTADNVQDAIEALFTSVSEGKSLIASAVTDMGIPTEADASFETMRNNILAIETGGGLPENMYTISLEASPQDGGEVSGAGVVTGGMNVTVSASENDGYFFEEWKENGVSVSTRKSFSFQVLENRNLTAVFSVQKLPTGYIELEYVQSNGNEWVDTGVTPGWDTKMVVDGQAIEKPSSGNSAVLFGEGNSSDGVDGNDFRFTLKSQTSTNYRAIFSRTTASIYDGTTLERRVFVISNNEASVGSETPISPYSPQNDWNDNHKDITIALFAQKGSYGSAYSGTYSKFRVYSCKIYNADDLIRDFVPCKNESGEIGLYDLVEDQFYGNSGTGTLVAGPVV